MQKFSISKSLRIFDLSLFYSIFVFVVSLLSLGVTLSANEKFPSIPNNSSPRSISEVKQHFNQVASGFFNICAKVFDPNVATNPYVTFIFDPHVTSQLFERSLATTNEGFSELLAGGKIVILEDLEKRIDEELERQQILRENIITHNNNPSKSDIEKIDSIARAIEDLSNSLKETERFYDQLQEFKVDFLFKILKAENFVRENLNYFPKIQKFFQPDNISKAKDNTFLKLNLFDTTSSSIVDYTISQSLSARVKALENIRGINYLVNAMLNTVGIRQVNLKFDHRITIHSKRDQTLLGENLLSEFVPRFTLVDLILWQDQVAFSTVYAMNKAALSSNETPQFIPYIDEQMKKELGFTKVDSNSSDLDVLFPQGALFRGSRFSRDLREFFTESHISYLISLGLYEIGFGYCNDLITMENNRKVWIIE